MKMEGEKRGGKSPVNVCCGVLGPLAITPVVVQGSFLRSSLGASKVRVWKGILCR